MSDVIKPKPFPALTPAQRLHIEIYGYVIIENLLTPSEVNTIKDTLYGIEDNFRRTGEMPGPNCFNTSTTENFFRIDNLPHLAPCFFDYITHALWAWPKKLLGALHVSNNPMPTFVAQCPKKTENMAFTEASTPLTIITTKGSITFPLSKPSPTSPTSAPTTAAQPS
jgi:hypothetical protein